MPNLAAVRAVDGDQGVGSGAPFRLHRYHQLLLPITEHEGLHRKHPVRGYDQLGRASERGAHLQSGTISGPIACAVAAQGQHVGCLRIRPAALPTGLHAYTGKHAGLFVLHLQAVGAILHGRGDARRQVGRHRQGSLA